jgi:Zn-dependent M28 family amino/carboxypeptidase
VNLDMPVALYPFADMVAFGAQHSTLKDSVARAAANADVQLSPDPAPEQGYFTRSDHYRLVQEGVPAVALDIGYRSRDPSIDGEALYEDFVNTHYHKPSDEPTLPIDYSAVALFATININIAREVCNQPEPPLWNAGNFFGETFGPTRMAAPGD